MKKYFLILLFFTWFSNENYLCAQFVISDSRSWIGMKPMEYNPSFAGSTGGTRIVGSGFYLIYNHSRPANNKLELSYDNFISKIRSGIAFKIAYQHYSSQSWASNASIVISPKISLKGKYTIAPSVEFTYGKFEDNNVFPVIEKLTYCHLRSGILVNSKKMYVGYTVYFPTHYINYVSRNDLIPNNFGKYHSFQIGYKFQRNSESKFSFTPQAVLILQGPHKRILTTATDTTTTYTTYADPTRLYYLKLDLNFRYKKILWGVGTPSVMLGFQSKKWRIMYTHHWLDNLGKILPGNFYVHRGELSVRLLIPKKNKTVNDF